MERYTSVQQEILNECSNALSRIEEEPTEQLLRAILTADTVFFTGVGRVLLSLKSVCKRFNHLGITACYVGEVREPAITQNDLLIVASGSGESVIPITVAKKAKHLGVTIALIGSNPHSTLSEMADLFVRIPVQTKLGLKDELCSRQPMTSLFEQCVLLYGDALAKMIVERKRLDMAALWQYHANLE